ncbi:S9 family peptidase [Actibacterium sp. 188UL27-1]|uniref:alpha/beta hydrolase family protein n=1 Tax=Actibacterium sp. 188UL27-1 TaxID=2786961 RepID=UPI00195B1864|nr:alpha/beta fold hydrolase [Actibacterium sp. 188UL27-1]MBM7066047.1 alpha/beta hydrolase [Actibacterium sp. 188UL27-1]
MLKRLALPIILGLALIAAALFWGLIGVADFQIHPDDRMTRHRFDAGPARLSGTLVLPGQSVNPPVALIVHGDGPQDRWSDDGYLPLVNTLLDAGIGVFSWDKPGIGDSTGNWLDQSMEDRAAEAAAALAYLRDTHGIAAGNLGYLGFSQAGWVVPQASIQADAAFVVLIGPAINWRIQGAYYTAKRLERQGLDPLDVDAQVAAELAQNDRLFTAATQPPDGMSADRYAFVRANYTVDATDDIAQMTAPALILLGADDLNVNPLNSARIYGEHLPDTAANAVQIIPDATHSLLRSGPYNFQLPDEWTTIAQVRFLAAGRRAFAPGSLERIADWIHARTAR